MEQIKKFENDSLAFERYTEVQRRSQNNIRSAKENFKQKVAKNAKMIVKVSCLCQEQATYCRKS